MKLIFFLSFLFICSFAFKPNSEGHVGITGEALKSLGFCRNARDAVENANVLTDIFEQFSNEAHFDGESINRGSRRMIDKKDEIVKLMDTAARLTNNNSFLLSLFDPFLNFFRQAAIAFTGSNLVILSTNDAQVAAWSALGQALHSLQDFYSHSNWVEMGNTSPLRDFGRRTVPSPPTNSQPCANDPGVLDLNGDGGSVLTTGYFDFNPRRHCALEDLPGKCRHGWNLAGCADGLNKDEPSRPNYSAARAVAVQATANYVALVLDSLGGSTQFNLFKGGNCNPLNDTRVFYREASTSGSSCDSFSFEIDQLGDNYVFSVNMQGISSVTIRDPNSNTLVNGGQVSISTSSNRIRYSLTTPQSGIYSVEVCGESNRNYNAELLANSRLFSYQSYFARETGSRNVDFFPHSDNQQPILFKTNLFYGELYGPDVDASTVRFSFIGLDGVTIFHTFTLPLLAQESDGAEFFGQVEISFTNRFLVICEGNLNNGNRFIRYFQTKVYQAQFPEVKYLIEEGVFQLGPDQTTTNFEFSVTNHDIGSITYDLLMEVQGRNGNHFSGSIQASNSRVLSSSRVTLASQQTITVGATLILDDEDGMEVGDLIEVTFTARGVGSPDNYENSIDVIGEYVSCKGNPICRGEGTCDINRGRCNCFDNSDDCDIDNGAGSITVGFTLLLLSVLIFF